MRYIRITLCKYYTFGTVVWQHIFAQKPGHGLNSRSWYDSSLHKYCKKNKFRFKLFLRQDDILINPNLFQATVSTHDKHTHNKHIANNKHTFFALTKMCYLWSEILHFPKWAHFPKIRTFSQNKHISQNKHTFFGLTKMCLLWVGTVIWMRISFATRNRLFFKQSS